jgi:sugar diacid utilization regulator
MTALERVQATGGVVALPALSAFDCLALFGHETARRRIAPAIKRFVAEDLAEGGVLTTTLLAYVACDFNTKVAAERLFIHTNTARYRLGKIEERTGCDLRRVADVLDLLIAVRGRAHPARRLTGRPRIAAAARPVTAQPEMSMPRPTSLL